MMKNLISLDLKEKTTTFNLIQQTDNGILITPNSKF